jgi:ATP-dependent protease ClpP protease subunit
MKSAVRVTNQLARQAMQTSAPAVSAVAAAAASEAIGLKVDGHSVKVARGATILDAIKKSKSNVPTLCFHPEFDPKAVCELCRISLDGFFS